jgi:hypothetical protein
VAIGELRSIANSKQSPAEAFMGLAQTRWWSPSGERHDEN